MSIKRLIIDIADEDAKKIVDSNGDLSIKALQNVLRSRANEISESHVARRISAAADAEMRVRVANAKAKAAEEAAMTAEAMRAAADVERMRLEIESQKKRLELESLDRELAEKREALVSS